MKTLSQEQFIPPYDVAYEQPRKDISARMMLGELFYNVVERLSSGATDSDRNWRVRQVALSNRGNIDDE